MCRRNESFRERSSVSHFFSAPVPVECTERMIWLRADFENVSATNRHFSPAGCPQVFQFPMSRKVGEYGHPKDRGPEMDYLLGYGSVTHSTPSLCSVAQGGLPFTT